MKTKGFVCLCSFLPLGGSEFLTCTGSLSLKYFWHFLQVRSTFLTGDRRLPFLFIWESVYFSITVNFPVYRVPGWRFSSFSTEHFTPLPLFARPRRVQGYCCPSVQVRRFFSGYSQDSLYLFFGFLQFEYNMPQSRFGIYHIWSSKLPGMVVWCPSLSLENSLPLLLQIFLLLLSILPWRAQRQS